MATTTTNYGWDIPQSTDLVKDGATAIALLGQDIDTSMNTALAGKKAGMVLLNTTSFSGVTSFSLNNVFSTTYDNYRIVMNLDAGTSNTFITFRLRVGGVDNSTASYNDMRGWDRATSFSATSSQIALNNSSAEGCAVMDIFRPFEAKVTNAISWFHGRTSSAVEAYNFHATQSQGLSFDGITFINAGNMTGKLSVYGYAK